ncbi:MAG: radical SAM protein [Candidatus Thorarchaeota archaeon]
MLVKNVDFLLTFNCDAECQHCSYKAGPKRTGFMKQKEASEYLKELTRMQLLKAVWVHGGEPFLYFDCLEHIIKEAKSLSIPRIGVITNSFWAKNKKNAEKKINRLKKAGLSVITFSSDFFHQEFIPLEYVKNALISATAIRFDKIYVDSYFVDDVDSHNYFNELTRNNLEILKGINGIKFHRFPMSVEGRGTNLIEYLKLKENVPSGKCPLPFWIEGNLQNPETIEIDCEGNVTLCPGISIGNTNLQSLTKIIQNYEVEKHPILSYIFKDGPIGLLKVAQAQGFQQNQQFVNECHLCYELRKFLQPFYSYSLTPKDCY